MIIVLKIILLLTLGTIAYQDMKDHLVSWFLFPVYGVLGSYLFYTSTFRYIYIEIFKINLLFFLAYLALLFLVLKFIVKVPFKKAIGAGDVLMYLALCISFPTMSFFILLIISLLLSYVLNLFINKPRNTKEVTYAGFTSMFLIGIYLAQWSGLYKNLYVL